MKNKRTLILMALFASSSMYAAEPSTVPGEHTFFKGFSTHKPMYLALGDDPVLNAKFQVSFKYQLWGHVLYHRSKLRTIN